MLAVQTKWTVQGVLERAAADPAFALERLELIEGDLIEMPPPRSKNSLIAGVIYVLVYMYALRHRLGWVTPADGGYQLGDGTYVIPDVGFITFDRAGELSSLFPVAPDLAVEVVSPGEKFTDKLTRYFAAGTRMVWKVDVDEREIHVITPYDDGSYRLVIVTAADTLTAGDVLPGFSAPASEIFAVLDLPTSAPDAPPADAPSETPA